MGSILGKNPLVVDTMKAGIDVSSGMVSSSTRKVRSASPRDPIVAAVSKILGVFFSI